MPERPPAGSTAPGTHPVPDEQHGTPDVVPTSGDATAVMGTVRGADPSGGSPTNGHANGDGADHGRGAPAADPERVSPAGGRTTPSQAVEPQAAEPQAAEAQAAEPRAAEPRTPVPQAPDPQAPDPQATDPRATGRPRSDLPTGRPATEEPADSPVAAPAADPAATTAVTRVDGPTVAMSAPRDVSPPPRSGPPSTRPDEAETTQFLPVLGPVDSPTERFTVPAAEAPADPVPPGDPSSSPSRRKRGLLIGGGVVVLLGLLYGGDLALSSGAVPRGVTVAGVPVGGLSLAAAEQTLRGEIEPRTTKPVPVTVGAASSEIDPTAAGLSIDWTSTLGRAGAQPLNPVTRVTSFFTSREIGVATRTDPAALEGALTELAPIVDKAPVEGTVRFDGTTPQAVQPVPGQHLDVPAAVKVMTAQWVDGKTVVLPVTAIPPATTPDQVQAALDTIATPAVSAPVVITGEAGTQGTLTPAVIAKALTFAPDPAAGLKPVLNTAAVKDALKPQLAASEKPGRDAALDFATGTAVVVPSQDGRGIDYDATLKDLLAVLTSPAPRRIAAVYADQPAKLTTEELTGLGISGVIGEFRTGGFAADSGQNIRRAAEQINGKVIGPGETFSLNAATNPRDAAHGYVEAGIIEDGHPSRGIGGGVSQVATTLYNASYFAGMANVEHKEHSFYISRYPPGREATVFDNVIDLKFRNDNPTAVMIRTVWTPSSLTVQILGTKRFDVTSTPGPRTNPTQPKTVTIPAGQPCSTSKGAPGFTVTDTRTLKEVGTGVVRTETRTVRYNPSPIVVCSQ